jgi:flagellar protein FlbD
MILVTRLNDVQFAVNPDLIERIHASPDTTLVMVEGSKYIVKEPMGQVIEMIREYRASVLSLARDTPPADIHGRAYLSAVPAPLFGE